MTQLRVSKQLQTTLGKMAALTPLPLYAFESVILNQSRAVIPKHSLRTCAL